MLKLVHVNKKFQSGVFIKSNTQAVCDVTFTINQGKTLGLAGNSGCGKTTISRMILGVIKPCSGEILYHDKNIATFTSAQRKQYHKEIQIIFQNPEGSMNPSKNVLDNLLEPMLIHKMYSSRECRTNKISEFLNMVGLSEHLLSHYPHQISGGEAQRLSICRALTIEPKVLILDEPTSMLDVSIQAHVMTLLQHLKQQLGLTYLYISHDIDLHKCFTDELIIMNKGYIIEQGETQSLLQSPQSDYTKKLLHSFNTWN